MCALDFALQRVIKAQDAGHVAAAVAVVWRRPHRHQGPICTARIASNFMALF